MVLLGRRNAHGAVERQLAPVHHAQDLGRLRDDVVALQAAPAEDHPRGLDLLGQADLFLTRQQWDGAHLREVHPHRVIDPLGTRVL